MDQLRRTCFLAARRLALASSSPDLPGLLAASSDASAAFSGNFRDTCTGGGLISGVTPQNYHAEIILSSSEERRRVVCGEQNRELLKEKKLSSPGQPAGRGLEVHLEAWETSALSDERASV